MQQQVLVSVVMITYGHEKYIREAIEGVLMQDINFEVELIIADDNSPDNTEQVVLNITSSHPNSKWIKYTKHKKNKGMMPNFIWALQQCKGKYIALCEGDDYWTDSYKLQKQVDFLEGNMDYGICWTNYQILRGDTLENTTWSKNYFKGKYEIVNLENYSKSFSTQTLTAVLRKEYLNLKLLSNLKYAKDITIFIYCLMHKNGAVLNENTAVYRVHPSGVYSMQKKTINYKNDFFTILEILIHFPNFNNKSMLDLLASYKKELKKNFRKEPGIFKKSIYFFILIKAYILIIRSQKYLLFKYL